MFSGFKAPSKKTIVAIAAAASLTLLAGCSDDATDSPPPAPAESSAPASAPSQQSGNEPDSAPPRTASDSNQALNGAGELALEQVADSTLISIESENDGAQWEVQVVTSDGVEHEMDISSDGAKLIGEPKIEDEDAEDKREHQDRVKAAKLDFKQAVDMVLAEVPGGAITELNLDVESNKTVWEADVKLDSEKRSVQIDAGSGDVLKNEIDD